MSTESDEKLKELLEKVKKLESIIKHETHVKCEKHEKKDKYEWDSDVELVETEAKEIDIVELTDSDNEWLEEMLGPDTQDVTIEVNKQGNLNNLKYLSKFIYIFFYLKI